MQLPLGHYIKRHLPSSPLGCRTLQVGYTHHPVEPTYPQAERRKVVESVEESSAVLLQATVLV